MKYFYQFDATSGRYKGCVFLDEAMLAKKSVPQPPADVYQVVRETPLPPTAKLLDIPAGVIRHAKYELAGYDEDGGELYALVLDSGIDPINIYESNTL